MCGPAGQVSDDSLPWYKQATEKKETSFPVSCQLLRAGKLQLVEEFLPQEGSSQPLQLFPGSLSSLVRALGLGECAYSLACDLLQVLALI